MFLLIVYISGIVVSYPQFRGQIPNGEQVPDPCTDGVWSAVGHANPKGGHERNPFGNDFAASGMVGIYIIMDLICFRFIFAMLWWKYHEMKAAVNIHT